MGLLRQDLSVRFSISIPTVSRTIVTWANVLYPALGSIPSWLRKHKIDDLIPECFKATYPNTRVIIDCTESRTFVEITKLSGFLDFIEPVEDVMADKGFTIRKLLVEKDVTLNIPSFLSSKGRFTGKEIQDRELIGCLRIHVERMNKRIKENHLFDSAVPMSLAGSINQLWTVACLIANFKGPIVRAWAQSLKKDN